MKKIQLLLIFMTVISIGICGCGNSNKAETKQSQENITYEQSSNNVEDEVVYSTYEMNDSITDEFFEWTFEKIWNSYDLLPSNTQERYRYFKGEEGKKYFYLQGGLKNVGTQEINLRNAIEAKCIFDDTYEYSCYIYLDEGDSVDQLGKLTPFETANFYMACQVPDELLEKYETVTFRWNYTNIVSEKEQNHYYEISTAENRASVGAYELYLALGGDPASYEENVKKNENAAETKDTNVTQEEKTYLLACEAMNNQYYGYALRLFNEIADYKDSQEYIDSLHDTVDPYNGNYTVQAFAGGTYNLKIKDGVVRTQFDNVSGALEYYFELYGITYDDGTVKMAMGSASDYDSDGIIDSVPDPTYDGENYIISKMDNGFMIMASEENDYTYWNGSTI